MKQFESLWMMPARLRFRSSRTEWPAVVCALVVLGIILTRSEAAIAQQQPSALDGRRAQLEVQKLELEVKRLAEDRRDLPGWLSGVLGLVVGVAGTAATIWRARRARHGALDQTVHEKRLESYPHLVDAAADFALYFPPAKFVSPEGCCKMGEAMRGWYFGGGGLLMSTEARDAYFALARALTRASLTEDLRVPLFPKDADHISVEAVDRYRRELTSLDLQNVEKWKFGGAETEMERAALRFKDFVFLQSLSSALRTRLCEDLHSRRRPS